ncbi:hypothetical protein [Paractinoplanes lichenicola]|uniref:Lipoprotein n=1 Tax=Paractinoplanes lichenicola TaxID=2802976 RepID=A0ABS1VF78_9ACTN|nr:hypothetical protein [Actinoplanes lichenicola]MBL7253344.1 hypothetical protein [Actinoplanes lichenicola]
MRKSFLVVGAAAVVVLSGCSGGVERVDGVAAPVAAPATSAPAATATTTPPATTATSPASAISAPTRRTSKPTAKACPVTNAQLQKALRAKPDDGVFPDSTFTKIVCFEGYAATTVPERSNSDESYVVWKHSAGSWSVLSSGTADICPGVPADVVRHFRAARYGACGQG